MPSQRMDFALSAHLHVAAASRDISSYGSSMMIGSLVAESSCVKWLKGYARGAPISCKKIRDQPKEWDDAE